MKFIRNLVSRRQQPEFHPGSDVSNQVAAFEDVIGYGEDLIADVENIIAHTADHDADPIEVEAPQPVRTLEPEELIAPEDPPEPVISVNEASQLAQNAYADAAFEESKDILDNLAARLKDEPVLTDAPVAKPSSADVKIWDIEDENDTVDVPAPVTHLTRAASAPAARESETEVIRMFEDAPEVHNTGQILFPVGWLVVASGPGRGASFPLEAGLSLIGRDPDQAVRLDFGDTSVARSNHAAVVYDPETHAFTLGHGGKKDIVRLNGKPVISNETLSTGDMIRIGDTTLHFVPLCTDSFDWGEEDSAGEHEHVAIA